MDRSHPAVRLLVVTVLATFYIYSPASTKTINATFVIAGVLITAYLIVVLFRTSLRLQLAVALGCGLIAGISRYAVVGAEAEALRTNAIFGIIAAIFVALMLSSAPPTAMKPHA